MPRYYRDDLSPAERRIRLAVLRRNGGRDLGWPWQCRCGSTTWMKHRGRFYCFDCGQRRLRPDVVVNPEAGSFRQAWIRWEG